MNKLLDPNRFVFTVLIPSVRYPEHMEELLRFAADHWKRTCLVTINKPSAAVLDTIERLRLDQRRFLIVDAVSRGAGIEERRHNVVYVSSPGAITELGIRVGGAIERADVEAVIFDSISALLVHAGEAEVLEFVHMLVSRVRGRRVKALFPVVREDLNTPAVKNLNMFADAVVDLKE